MLETLLACGVRQFVFSSSAAVYGEPEQVPILEHHPARLLSPSGRTKLFFEHVLEDFRFGLRTAVRVPEVLQCTGGRS